MIDVKQWLNDNYDKFTELSDKIWEYAETKYVETKSAELIIETLENEGFNIEKEVADIPTAFVATYGSGKTKIGILGEYDALPGLSQDTVAFKKPRIEGAAGHGCGHNLLGVGSLAAVISVKHAIDSGKLDGTIQFFGCPAEEGGAAKTFMVRAGVFDHLDVALTWHPGTVNGVMSMNLLARAMAIFRFHGKAAHAAGDPYNGRSALDAVELMNVGCNYLREHIIPDGRIHYSITKGGGAPNVVPDIAESLYYVRAPTTLQVREIYDRVVKVAKGAAMMTETEVEIIFHSGTSNLVLIESLEKVMHEKMKESGEIEYTEEEIQYAKEIVGSRADANKGVFTQVYSKAGEKGKQFQEMIKGKVLLGMIMPYYRIEKVLPGSTDVGDVSWVVPTAQVSTTCHGMGTPGHSWELVAQGGMSIGHKGLLLAAKTMALTAIELMSKQDLVSNIKEEFKEYLQQEKYLPPIYDDTKLPFLVEDLIPAKE
ncbi:MAG: M20 family metallopeptidase [Candidatus Kariarchaeaceae archaeon]